MNLRPLIARLTEIAPDLDAHGIAEVLWLAAVSSAATPEVQAAAGPSAPPDAASSSSAPPSSGTPDAGTPADRPEAQTDQAELRDTVTAAGATEPGRRVGLQPAAALPQALDLARALRPFKRQWPRGRRLRLDIDATVTAYAETNRLVPVFRPAPERWFDVAVVVDDSPSIAIWDQTIAEFGRTLEQVGAFRQVRTWRLAVDGDATTLRNTRGLTVQPRQLLTADRRRLILVLTDGLAPHWDEPPVWKLLRTWSAATPTAVVNPLSTRLWGHTGLDQPAVTVTPTEAVGRMAHSVPAYLRAVDDAWQAVPAVTISPYSVGQWARSTMRNEPLGCDALLVPSAGRLPLDDEAAGERSAAEVLQSFLHIASEASASLAVLCAPYSQVTLPLLTLLRQELLPSAQLSDVAELVVAGLASAEQTADGQTVLRLHEDVRPLLLERLSEHDAWQAYRTLSTYVAKHAGQHGSLAVAVPDPAGDVEVPSGVRPFAAAAREVLHLLQVAAAPASDAPVVMDDALAEADVAEEPARGVVVLRHQGRDRVWADWIGHLLDAVGYEVANLDVPDSSAPPRVLIIHSGRRPGDQDLSWPPSEPGSTRQVLVDFAPPYIELPDISSADITGLEADHAARLVLALVGFLDPTDIPSIVESGPRYPGRPPATVAVPKRNPKFNGREDEFDRLRRLLAANPELPVAIRGMRGAGKTELAREYAHRFGPAYDAVIWVASGSDAGTYRALQIAAREIKDARSTLLIFEDSQPPDSIMASMGRGQQVIFTTRALTPSEQANALPLGGLRRPDSIVLLQTRLPALSVDGAHRIARMLDDFPLALDAVATWLVETGMPPHQLIDLLAREGLRALGRMSRDLEAWISDVDRLQVDHPQAYHLLQLFSVLAPEIARGLVESDAFINLLARKPGDVRGGLDESLLVLARRGFAWRNDKSIHVHPFLQNVVRSEMSVDELDARLHGVRGVLGALRPSGDVDDPDMWPDYLILWPHLDIARAERSFNPNVRRLVIDRVRHEHATGDLAAAEIHARAALDAWSTSPDSPHRAAALEEILELQGHLADILRGKGDFEAAYAIGRFILDEQTAAFGADHVETVSAKLRLTADLRCLGRFAASRELAEDALDSSSRVYGPDHPETLSALSSLARAYRLLGEYRQAESTERKAHELWLRTEGYTSQWTLRSLAMIGYDTFSIGHYAEASTTFSKVLDAAYDLSDDSIVMLPTQVHLSVCRRRMGLLQSARNLAADAHRQLEVLVGPHHPDTVAARQAWALANLTVGEGAAAATDLAFVLERYQERLGSQHPHALAARMNLVVAENSVRPGAERRRTMESVALSLAERVGQHHPHTLIAQMNAEVLRFETDDADPVRLRNISEALAVALGAGHPIVSVAQANTIIIMTRLHPEVPGGSLDDLDAIGSRLTGLFGDNHQRVRAIAERNPMLEVIDPLPL